MVSPGPSARPIFERRSPVGLLAGDSRRSRSQLTVCTLLEEPHVAWTGSPQEVGWLVERVNTSTGATSTVATVTLPEFWNGPDGTEQPDAVIIGETLFVLADQGGGGTPDDLGGGPMVSARRAVFLLSAVLISAGAGLLADHLDTPAAPQAGWSDSGGGLELVDIACATQTWCVGLQPSGGQNAATTWTGHDWTPPVSVPPYQDYVALSCPAVGSCIALTSNGLTLRLANGIWRLGGAYDHQVTGAPYGSPSAALSCSSIDACVAVNGAGDEVTLGTGGWARPVRIDDVPLTGVSCPAPGSCVAADGEGRILTSVGGRFGSPRQVAPDALQAVACASADFCAVADLDGAVRVGDPDHLGPLQSLGPPDQPIALACPSAGVCIAAGPEGGVAVLSSGRWRVVEPSGPASFESAGTEFISCPAGSSDFCAIGDGITDVQVGGAPFLSLSTEVPATTN